MDPNLKRLSLLLPDDSIFNNYSRDWIAKLTVAGAFLLIMWLSYLLIEKGEGGDAATQLEVSRYVFTTIIPLVATWVGTVLAFFFGKDNFQEASRNFAKVLHKDLLDDIPISNIMIDLDTIVYKIINEPINDQEKVSSLTKFLETVRKDRLPFFTKELKAKYIIHKSTFDAYLSANPDTSKDLMKAFFEDENQKDKFAYQQNKGFIVVAKNESLENAIRKIKTVQNCKDIFITENGGEQEQVLGWVTDSLINRYLKLK